jgi:hypothetical protein
MPSLIFPPLLMGLSPSLRKHTIAHFTSILGRKLADRRPVEFTPSACCVYAESDFRYTQPPRQQLTKPWRPLWLLFGRADFADERYECPRTIGIRYRTFRR